MKWLLRDLGAPYSAIPPDRIGRRLRFALARLGDRVERVIVFLQDINGPKEGVDKECRTLATVQGYGVIMATVADSEWIATVDRATTRIGHTLSRQTTSAFGTGDSQRATPTTAAPTSCRMPPRPHRLTPTARPDFRQARRSSDRASRSCPCK